MFSSLPDGILGTLIFFSAVRKKPRFTHDRDNLRGDVSGKRFNTHVMEGNVAGVARGQRHGGIKKIRDSM